MLRVLVQPALPPELHPLVIGEALLLQPPPSGPLVRQEALALYAEAFSAMTFWPSSTSADR